MYPSLDSWLYALHTIRQDGWMMKRFHHGAMEATRVR